MFENIYFGINFKETVTGASKCFRREVPNRKEYRLSNVNCG